MEGQGRRDNSILQRVPIALGEIAKPVARTHPHPGSPERGVDTGNTGNTISTGGGMEGTSPNWADPAGKAPSLLSSR
eukprot:12572207-Alexandrium_andersonii.AAC.1